MTTFWVTCHQNPSARAAHVLSVILPCCTELDKGREARCYDSALAVLYTHRSGWLGGTLEDPVKMWLFEEIVVEKSMKTGLSLNFLPI